MATQTIPLTEPDAPAWYQFVTNFDQAYQQFYDNYNGLMAQGPYIAQNHPEMLDWYNTELQNASEAAYKLEQLKSTRDTVAGWLNTIGAAISNIEDYFGSLYNSAASAVGLQGYNGLGIVPLVYIGVSLAVASAALAIIIQAINKMYDDAQRINALKSLTDKGYTGEQASAIVNQTLGVPGASSGTFFGLPIPLMIWGAMAIVLGPSLIKAFTEGRGR